MDENAIKKVGLELIESSPDVIVATIGQDGFPYIRIMFNLRGKRYPKLLKLYESHQDDFLIYLGTNTSSQKVEQIIANPLASLFFFNAEAFHSLMLAGRVEIVNDLEVKRSIWQEGWEMYYPAGISDPDYTVLRFQPAIGRGWYRDSAYYFSIGESR